VSGTTLKIQTSSLVEANTCHHTFEVVEERKMNLEKNLKSQERKITVHVHPRILLGIKIQKENKTQRKMASMKAGETELIKNKTLNQHMKERKLQATEETPMRKEILIMEEMTTVEETVGEAALTDIPKVIRAIVTRMTKEKEAILIKETNPP